MVDYAAIQQKAETKIKEFGAPITVRITERGSYNATTDSYTESYTDYETYGLRRSYKQSEMANTLIRANDVEFLISNDSLPALREDDNISIIDGDSTWYPVRIPPLKPGETVLLYKIQAAREKR